MATFQIKSRFSGAVIFETEIAAECDGNSYDFRLGLAVKAACKSGVDLQGADLRYADLRYADLRGSNLRGSNLRGSNLRYADLSYADLSYADLQGADLRYADLQGADLQGAEIERVVARATRVTDGYEFIAFGTDKGVIIRAGCRTMSLAEYRDHVAREYPGTDKAEETLSILDYIEARAAALCKVECR